MYVSLEWSLRSLTHNLEGMAQWKVCGNRKDKQCR